MNRPGRVKVNMSDLERIERYVLREDIPIVEFARRVSLPMSTVAGLLRRVHYWGETTVEPTTWDAIDGFLKGVGI